MASAVSIYIKRGEQVLGPFSEEQTVTRYHRGDFNDGDLAMIEGVTGWHPLATYIVDDSEDGPASFDTSAQPPLPAHQSPPPPPPERRTSRFTETDEPRPEPIFGAGRRGLTLVNPIATAWALLGIGVLVMFLSKWPWTLWVPVILAAIALAVQQLVRRNFAHAAPLLLIALLLPWFVWSIWLAPAKPTPVSAIATHQAPPATPAPAVATPAPIPEAPRVAVEPPPATPAPLATPPPAPNRTFAPGDRVALAHDAMLYFNNKEFRMGKASEEFEVLQVKGGRLYLKTRDSSSRIIAVSVLEGETRLVAAAAPQ